MLIFEIKTEQDHVYIGYEIPDKCFYPWSIPSKTIIKIPLCFEHDKNVTFNIIIYVMTISQIHRVDVLPSSE